MEDKTANENEVNRTEGVYSYAEELSSYYERQSRRYGGTFSEGSGE